MVNNNKNRKNNGNSCDNRINKDLKYISPAKTNFGDRAADIITEVVGSWKFLIIQSAILVLWMGANVVAWIYHWDPYPFILLNLALSFQAAYAAPIIMMSQNRMAEKDRRKNEADLALDRKTDRAICEIQKQLNRMEKKIQK